MTNTPTPQETIREEWFKTDLAKEFAPFEDAVPSFFLDKCISRTALMEWILKKKKEIGLEYMKGSPASYQQKILSDLTAFITLEQER